MDLLRKAGQTFEKTRQAFIEGREADFVCTSCEEPVEDAAEQCPHCGEPTVEPVE